MRAVDTNVLLRYFVRDDREQALLATRFVEDELSPADPGFVSIAVLCEAIWTLRSGFGADEERIREAVLHLLQSPQMVVAEQEAVRSALAERDLRLTDAIIHHLGLAAGCAETVTFDRRFARADDVRLLG